MSQKNLPQSAPTQQPCESLSKSDIAGLWSVMAQMYGHKWVSSYGETPDPHGVWLATLRGISKQGMRMGLSRLSRERREWPPSAPEFAGMCQPGPEDFGLPDLETVTDRIISTVLSDSSVKVHLMSKPVYAVWRQIHDTYSFRLSDESTMRKKVKQAYQAVLNNLIAGKELPEVPLPLEKPQRKSLPPEQAAHRMDALKNLLGDNA